MPWRIPPLRPRRLPPPRAPTAPAVARPPPPPAAGRFPTGRAYRPDRRSLEEGRVLGLLCQPEVLGGFRRLLQPRAPRLHAEGVPGVPSESRAARAAVRPEVRAPLVARRAAAYG